MPEEISKLKLWPWQGIGAVFCFGGGILLAIVGSVLTALTWVLGVEIHPWLRGLGTLFLFITIPLLISAGYCLDWLEDAKTEGRPSPVSKHSEQINGEVASARELPAVQSETEILHPLANAAELGHDTIYAPGE